MATAVTFTCDKCKEEYKERDDVSSPKWNVGVVISYNPIYQNGANSYRSKTGEWCRSCCVKAGLLPKCEEDPEPKKPEPTLEELVTDILRGIVNEELEARG